MMKAITVEEACKAVGGIWRGNSEGLSKAITSVIIDSRKAEDGALFVAIPGDRVDGHDYIKAVLENGAVCAVSERELDLPDPSYILVQNTRKALRDLAAYYRSILDITVVGVTGSVGKTSTKEMIASVLSERFCVQKTAGNFNNEIGLPLTVFSIEERHRIAVLEMGISDFGEMSRLAEIARPDLMVITNIGQCHLENLIDRDGVRKAKTECFEYLKEDACVILNGMDDKLAQITDVQGKRPYFFGISDDPQLPANAAVPFSGKGGCQTAENPEVYASASEVKNLGFGGSECILRMKGPSQPDLTCKVQIPVAGKHMVINVSAAATVGLLLGMTAEEIASGVSKAEAIAGRGKRISTSKYLLIDDCYNANPASMKAELALLALSPGRRVALLGDMFELGAAEKDLHYEVGAYAASCCDVLIGIGNLSECMCEGAKQSAGKASLPEGQEGPAIYHFSGKQEFLDQCDDLLREGDTILLKASHGMDFHALLEELQVR